MTSEAWDFRLSIPVTNGYQITALLTLIQVADLGY